MMPYLRISHFFSLARVFSKAYDFLNKTTNFVSHSVTFSSMIDELSVYKENRHNFTSVYLILGGPTLVYLIGKTVIGRALCVHSGCI